MGGERQPSLICFAIACILLCAGLASAAVETSVGDSFIPAHATVVLLAGLSGDVESEKAYQSQLQGWLEVLETVPNVPQKVVVFSESPEAGTSSSKFAVQSLKASREAFLALGGTLSDQTNPVVILAWGHGGMQGKWPVFHVAGPRLTAVDFKAFDSKIAGADSKWLLFFLGSGSFATELASKGRSVIASEKETMFTSDPVGMPLVLKAVRANPAISFRALADELGRTVAAWYKERNLARTEEPTLWTGGEPPRILAPQEEEATPKAGEAEKESDSTIAIKTTGLPATTNLSAAWKGISRVEPQKYPDADGIVLRRRIDYTLGSSPAVASENEEFIQILTADGKHLGDFDFSYSPPFENITFLDCEILRPDGKLLRLDPDEVHDAAEESLGDYHTSRRKILSLPGVVPGAVLHVHFVNEWKTFPLPYVSLEIPLASELPILDSSVRVSLPKDAAFHFAFEQIAASDPSIKQTVYGSSYSWQFQDVPANEREALSPPLREPALMISTFPDWETFAGWFTRISQLADKVTPEISAKAAELTNGAKDDRERAVMLFDYVTSLRYVAVPLGVNSFRPHAAANVLKNQYGDCKDKANLFNTLLRSLNIDAHLVLVPRFTQAIEGLPGFAFNHAISRVTVGGESIWIDTTDDVCRFGMLPPGDPGRKVLVVDGKSNGLTQLPPPTPKAHQLKLHGRVNCSDNTDDPPVTLEATAVGYPDYELRSGAQDFKGQKTSLPLLALKFRPVAGVFGMEKQTHTPVSTLSDNFEWQAEGSAAGILSSVGDKHLLRAPFWLPKEWEAALNRRKTALFLHQGYPLLLDEDFEISLPAKAQQIALPATRENVAEPLSWKIEWSRGTDTAVSARLHIELARGELSLADTTALQKQLRELLFALSAGASFALPP